MGDGDDEGRHDGFDDVVSGVHASAIDALAQLGVFEGTECGEGLFCPDEPIRRWVMAVWLVRVLEAPLPEAGASRFSDVDPQQWWSRHVEALADLGITAGCSRSPARYCPDEAVSRAQMASFLARAFHLEPSEEGERFSDVSGGVHAANIDALAASGITAGCATDPARYCPTRATTRAQMASFLKRTRTMFIGPCPTEATDDTGTISGLADGTTYSVRVAAVNDVGAGAWSEPVPGIPATAPEAPRDLVVTPGDSRLGLSWQPPGDTGGVTVEYVVQWRSGSQQYSSARSQTTGATTATVTGLANGTPHTVQVAAVNAAGAGGSTEATNVVPRTTPSAPLRLEATVGDGSLALRWQPPSSDGGDSVNNYIVQWRTDGEDYATTRQLDAAGTSAAITGLANGAAYWVQVAAVNAAGAGAWSAEATKTPAGVPDAPREVTAASGDRSLDVAWEPPPDNGSEIERYVVQWKAGGDYSTARQRTTTTTSAPGRGPPRPRRPPPPCRARPAT